jgi:hypothetical protein
MNVKEVRQEARKRFNGICRECNDVVCAGEFPGVEGVGSGVDVFKILALGAHVVVVGGPLAVGAIGVGGDGVRLPLEQMRNELKAAMIYTGRAGVCEIGKEALWR